MAYVGSAPAACSATVSSDVVVVLPWVPATARTRRPGHHRGQRRRPGQQPQPLAPGLDYSGLSSRDGRGDDQGVDVADLLGVVAEVAPCAELAQGRQGRRVVAVAAADGDAAGAA